MSNLNIVTYNARATQVEQEYFSPVASIQGSYPIGTFYAFLGRVDPWPIVGGVETPEQPQQTQQYIKQTFKNMFAAKKLYSSNLSPVVQRINWTTNTVYSAYSDMVDMFQTDSNGFLINQFYIKNRYDQVFKCLCNNNGGASVNEPFFQPGTYQTNNIFANAGDGYKWKYIYTIDAGSKKTFMDSNWMPVPVSANTPQPYLTEAGYGDIEVINVINGGSGYDAVNTYIVVTVTGDGVGSSANVTPQQISSGIITDVVVGSAGSNYTTANATIAVYASATAYTAKAPPILTHGSGAIISTPVSPVGGHAYDPVSELGVSNLMLVAEFNGSENGIIPANGNGPTYRQVGILVNPFDYNSFPHPSSNAIFNLATQLTVSTNQGNVFNNGEIVVQQDNNFNTFFSGTVLDFNTSSNILQLINTAGTFQIGATVKGLTTFASRTLLTVSPPQMIPFSGYLSYIENRVGVQRSADGIEQFKFVLGYGTN
jgi:hypothetical protein